MRHLNNSAIGIGRSGEASPTGSLEAIARLRLHEKGGKYHEMPVHHTLEEYLDAYIKAAGIAEDKKMLLFRTAIKRTGVLSDRPLPRANALHMIQRRAKEAEVKTAIGYHTFRATGVTIYLLNGG